MDEFYQVLKKHNLGDDVHPVITSNFNDAGYLRELSHTKRFLELFTMDAEFKEEAQKGNSKVLDDYSLDLSLEDMRYLCDEEKAVEFKNMPLEKRPRIVRRYKGFILEKVLHRNDLLQKGCVPDNYLFRKWRQRQVNRCWGELGSRNSSIIHTPLVFELAKGCSVGCPFCGVSAGKLSKLFLYTPENSKLWLDILNKCREIIGPAAGTGICYMATEPLDNPDYEKFSQDYHRVFAKLPQITTATAEKNIERLKTVLKNHHALYPLIHRFSILSPKSLKTILSAFSPEELLYVELLPQFKEAPASGFASSGRAFNNKDVLKEGVRPLLGETISCVTGFVVNMTEKTIRLTTPCGASAKSPNGEIVLAVETFENALDFGEKINILIEKHMAGHIPRNLPLMLQPYYTHHYGKGSLSLTSGEGAFKITFKDDAGGPEILKEISQLLPKGNLTAKELVTELYEKKDFEPSLVYNQLNNLYTAGVLVEYAL